LFTDLLLHRACWWIHVAMLVADDKFTIICRH